MWFGILGLIIGIIIGVYTPLQIPVEYARYSAVGIIAVLDSVLGAIRADYQHRYNATIFISGLITNMVLAAVITYVGDRLGIDLYLAIIVAFTIRMLNNIGIVRYFLLIKYLGRKDLTHEVKPEKKELPAQ